MAADTATIAPVSASPQSATASAVGARIVAALPLAAVALLLPMHSDQFGRVAAYAAIFVMVGLSMNVLTGYTGQISLGHQAFVGLGALTAANVVSTGITPADPFMFGVGMVSAAAAAAGAALLLGAVALRIRGLYLALVTLVFGSVFADAIFTLPSLNGQDAGVSAYRPSSIATEYRYYVFALVMVLVCVYA